MGRQMRVGASRLIMLLVLVVLSSASFLPKSLTRASHRATRAWPQAGHPHLCSTLTHLALVAADDTASLEAVADDAGVPVVDGRVQVLVTVRADEIIEVRRAIEGLGGRVTGSVASQRWLQAWIPATSLRALADSPLVAHVRVPDLVRLDDESMPAASLALADSPSLMGASLWHLSGHRGHGVKIGIIDVGFGGHRALLGDALPEQVVARTFVDDENDDHLNSGSTHGTAVAEIVHRIAPQAELYLAKIGTVPELHEAATWLVDEVGVQVIHTSPRWYALTPGDGTGAFAELVQAAHAQGIVWVAPAGDARILHWSGDWIDENEEGWLDWGQGEHINLLILDEGYTLPPDMPIDIWLRWSDWELVDQDLDLCLFHWHYSSPEIVACSSDPQTGLSGQRPIERLRASTADYPRFYGIGVRRVHGDRPVHLDIFVAGVTTLQHRVPGQSLAEMADVPDVLSISAVTAQTPYEQAVYSSEGPTKGPGGIAANGLAKPDLSAYAGVATVSRGSFAGTAAAAAHVTGAVALVRGAHPTWGPDQVRSFLWERALDLGAPGWDPVYGHGRLHLGQPPTLPPAQYWLPLARR